MKEPQNYTDKSLAQLEKELNEIATKHGEATRAEIVTRLIKFRKTQELKGEMHEQSLRN